MYNITFFNSMPWTRVVLWSQFFASAALWSQFFASAALVRCCKLLLLDHHIIREIPLAFVKRLLGIYCSTIFTLKILTKLPQNTGGRFCLFLFLFYTWKPVVLFEVTDVHVRPLNVVFLIIFERQLCSPLYHQRSLSVLENENRKDWCSLKECVHFYIPTINFSHHTFFKGHSFKGKQVYLKTKLTNDLI